MHPYTFLSKVKQTMYTVSITVNEEKRNEQKRFYIEFINDQKAFNL